MAAIPRATPMSSIIPTQGLNLIQAIAKVKHAMVPPTKKEKIAAATFATPARSHPTNGIQAKSCTKGANSR